MFPPTGRPAARPPAYRILQKYQPPNQAAGGAAEEEITGSANKNRRDCPAV